MKSEKESFKMWKHIRVSLLLIILTGVWWSEHRSAALISSWNDTITIALYTISGNKSEVGQEYIKELSADEFIEIERFMSKEARRYGLKTSVPIKLHLQAQ